MISSDLKLFILINIYILIVVDILLIICVYFILIRSKYREQVYEIDKQKLRTVVQRFIEIGDNEAQIKSLLKTEWNQNLIIDIMIEYSNDTGVNISKKFSCLELDETMIDRLTTKLDMGYLRKLVFMESDKAYSFLMKTALDEDFNFSYLAFIGLSMIELPQEEKESAIQQLIDAMIARNRKIEVISRFQSSFEEWFDMLEKQTSIDGKVIFLNCIGTSDEVKNSMYSDRLIKFLYDEKEVRVAAVFAICSTGNEKYLDILSDLYDSEEEWEVRVSMAKGLSYFSYDSVSKLFAKMTRDSEWWVRYDAIKSVVKMGDKGIFELIELSTSGDKNTADLAYYFLNSSRDAYNTVKNVGV